jgi:PTS system mannose-specific IIB component
MIKLVRLDYRLLHGQVCFTWVQHVGAHRVIIVDQASATDNLKKSALKLAKPQGVRLNVFTLEQIMAKMPKVKQLNENIIVIFGDVHDLATFAQAYPEIGEINYGATANRNGATQVDQSVFLLPSEIEDTRAILATGVKIYSQQTPSHTRTNITSI